MRKILIFTCFIIATLLVFGMFISATTYVQLAVAAAIYPLLVYVAFIVFPRKNFSHSLPETTITIQPPPVAKKTESTKTDGIGIADIDKRVFLKLIGGTGLLLFLFSLFNKKGENLFYKYFPGSFPDKNITSGKADPNQSLNEYKISEMDSNSISFYGFVNKDGAWYIMKEDPETGSFRYVKGDSNFPNNWPNRTKLKYDYFSNVF